PTCVLHVFATFFSRRPLQFFANFGSFTKFLRRFCHQHWIRSRRRNRSHWPRHFPWPKPLNFHAETNPKCVIKHGYCRVACSAGGRRDWNSFARLSSSSAQRVSLAGGSLSPRRCAPAR